MGVKAQLKRWQKAGLIDERLAGKILAYEIARQSGRFGAAMLGLGALAIALGAVAVAAANWDVIPPFAKIAFQIFMNLGLAAGVMFCVNKRKDTAREILLFLQAAAVLTFIAIIGMIYQTGAPAWQALLLWLVLVSPVLFMLARARFTIVVWLLMLAATITSAFDAVDAHLAPLNLDMAFYALIPFVLLGVGQSEKIVPKWPSWPRLLTSAGYVVLVVLVSGAQIFWSFDMKYLPDMLHDRPAVLHLLRSGAIGFLASALALGALWFWNLLGQQPKKILPFLAASIILGFLPFLIQHSEWSVVGAALFMIYWAMIGWTGLQLGHRGLLNVAIVVIALRLFIVYVEVFGSLLSTGFGLIISGVVLIALVVVTRKVIRKLGHAA